MKEIDINTWNRKNHYRHFMALSNPYFAVTVSVDVTRAYQNSKASGNSFFVRYLHDCMKAINDVENLRYRIRAGRVFDVETIHASATIMREDNTFGFSWIPFNSSYDVFYDGFLKEKHRIQTTTELYPLVNGDNCIHCSAMPWFDFTSQKEPVSGKTESIPQLSFSKVVTTDNKMRMNVAINVNHALVDGYHLGQFIELFQTYLDK